MMKFLTPISILLSGLIIAGAILVSGNNFTWPSFFPWSSTQATSQKTNSQNLIPGTMPTLPAPPPLPVLKDFGTNPPLGTSSAKVKVVEFGDYQCPYCRQFFLTVEPQIKKELVAAGKAQFFFRDLTVIDTFIPGGHESKDAALAARCAGEQGQFWPYHDKLYQNQGAENQGAFKAANLKRFARDLRLKTAKFNKCFDDRKYDKEINDDISAAQAGNVGGTPTVFIDGQIFKNWGSYEMIKQAVAAAFSK